MAGVKVSLPSVYRKFVVTKLSSRFREAVECVTVPLPQPAVGELLIKNRYLGINASDINFTAGRYDPRAKPPFDAGFEAIGEIVATGENCKANIGDHVAYMKNGAFSEYITVDAGNVIPLPAPKAEFLPFLVSGLTASIAMEKVGEIKSGENVLVTAAAGGTGQFAVQWAKNAGCHVIGTCSSDKKAEFLRSIGCDRPVNYKKENLHEVLKKEYPKGIDVAYESVGGEMFDAAISRLALKGRLILIGYITNYQSETGIERNSKLMTLPARLLTKSASVRGFFLFHYAKDFKEYLSKQVQAYMEGKIKSNVDTGENSPTGRFCGLDSVPDAIDYLYTGKNIGKIVVDMQRSNSKL